MTIEDQSYVFTWILPKHHNSGISALYTREQRAVSWPSWTAAVGSGYNAVTLSQAVSWPSWTAAAGSGYNAQAKAVGDVISLEMPESTQSIFNLLQSTGSQEAYFIFDNIVFRQQARKCTCEVNWK